MKNILMLCLFLLSLLKINACEPFVSYNQSNFIWIDKGKAVPILVDKTEYKGVLRAVNNLQTDAWKVTGVRPDICSASYQHKVVIIGSIENSHWIKLLMDKGLIDKKTLQGKCEKYIIQTVKHPTKDIDEAVVIAGSDKRGTIYGIYELSSQMGISPWYYWADVPVKKHATISLKSGQFTDGEPAVRYRGIFLNDEYPALGGWANEKFGGFNSKFYEKVFELILRLKGNFMWPAMWNNAFYDDDPKNGPLADEMGIVMGTSHHEPMGENQQDWKRRGSGPWDYATNGNTLRDFWRKGIQRCKGWESVITVGMRGDGDEPMSGEANISLLENIVKDQRSIITDITDKKASKTPQVWALYKEVQDYYDKGMRVPDDVTLLLCDDNWGNVRRLPDLNAKPRKGGYGIYYHFDYVGAPRNSKWLNVTQIQRTWEQLNLTYEHNVRKLWIVNVGDLKPMEYPIQFFMDMAWNPKRYNENNLIQHTENFCKQQFGEQYAKEAARLINTYSKYNRRVTPELLNAKTYSLNNYNEWKRVMNDYKTLDLDALRLCYLMPDEYRDAYDQLVLFPIQACSNLYEMYYAQAMNQSLVAQNDIQANIWGNKVKECFKYDSLLTYHYNRVISGGKWNHMMDQTHIGYRSWFDPRYNVMPQIQYVTVPNDTSSESIFIEKDGYVSIEAEHYTEKVDGKEVHWIIIPGLGRTLSGVSTSPCTKTPDKEMCLKYKFSTNRVGDFTIALRFSATLNFNDYKGLRYAISVDNEKEQIININKDYRGELGKWQEEQVINVQTQHHINIGEIHTLTIHLLDPALILQKIMIDFGGIKPSFLGPPESKKNN